MSQLPRFPVTGATGLLALVVSLGWWAGRFDVAPLTETALLRRGEWWRLLTSVLPHVNLLHLAFNLYWLWVFGTLVEQAFGHVRTLGLFVLLAAASGGAEFALLDGGVGLSGVGYGLFGLLWVLGRGRGDPRFAGAVDAQTAGLFAVWFFVCIVTTVSGAMRVANVAHGVGALVGAGVGLAVASRGAWRALAAAGVAVLAAACVAGATVGRPYVNVARNAGADEAYLGYVALTENRNEAALRWLRDAVRMNPDDARNWFNLGIACERLGRHDEAGRAYARARQLRPNDPHFGAAPRTQPATRSGNPRNP